MKKSNQIFAVIILIVVALSSCTKQDMPTPSIQNQPPQAFTGVVFSQIKSDSCNTIAFTVRNFSNQDIVYYSTNTVLGADSIFNTDPSQILSGTIPLTVGDSISILAYKTSDPYYLHSEDNENYQINIKVYLNGNVIKDETQNYFNPNYPIQF